MKRLLLIFLLFSSPVIAEKDFYSNTRMGIDYKLFINDKEPLDGGYRYKFRTRYESESRTTIVDWRIADCLKSSIDGKLVPAIARYGYERGMPELIREICGVSY